MRARCASSEGEVASSEGEVASSEGRCAYQLTLLCSREHVCCLCLAVRWQTQREEPSTLAGTKRGGGGNTQRVQGNVHTNWRCVCSRTCMCMECLYFCVIQVQFVQTNPH